MKDCSLFTGIVKLLADSIVYFKQPFVFLVIFSYCDMIDVAEFVAVM